MHMILALLLAFCLSVSPASKWDCKYHPTARDYTCDSHESDSYYTARVDHKARAITVYQTDGDSYTDYVTTIEIK